ncbi:MAG TPA: 2,3-bisphosphoglycerate-independent phosphoglycerate mutase [bacterium]|nr:2,3-bisphosphoglycerate-independent phosphoglycerate mutase [bacterium]HMW34083.1 2,3-bisphosphoglycerate-independent phosphoglycerate mutase [bacterium]HMY35343.1 2,3-bisphosphoglycerate-independent phosphoglycerate mutase [bacterium]HMZ03739.1 2,3-bisphosphoglycerate-independent phosphoglycerate mutase [bacterium]HNB08787.1 2,3-bisphosphoglycerate-independent phosphoglycerate mutase [bacterium]
MTHADLVTKLVQKTDSKIVLLVMDGLGGIRTKQNPKTELERANIPNLHTLAKESVCGRIMPVSYGITPGSGPAHFSLFGYNPADDNIQIGRGVLEALGLDMKLQPGDVATRCNFATMDTKGLLTDRRAGRIPSEECERLCAMLGAKIKKIEDVKVIIKPGEQYRFVVVFRGKRLHGNILDTDPQVTGAKPLKAVPQDKASTRMSKIADKFIAAANKILKDETKANTLLMRGFSGMPHVPSMSERFGLAPACIASFPLYRGVASVVGMEILPTGMDIADEFQTLKENWDKHDFFFIHIKKTDSYGEDGNSEGKMHIMEEVDKHIPMLRELGPAVIMVTGDHSTPPPMKSHSWHPVPFLLHSDVCSFDDANAFTETECSKGQLGNFPSYYIMELALANAGKLKKFGA